MHTFKFQSKKKQKGARAALKTQKSRMLKDENLQLNECDMCKGRHITANCSLKCDTNGPALLKKKKSHKKRRQRIKAAIKKKRNAQKRKAKGPPKTIQPQDCARDDPVAVGNAESIQVIDAPSNDQTE